MSKSAENLALLASLRAAADHIVKLKAENERLTEALRNICRHEMVARPNEYILWSKVYILAMRSLTPNSEEDNGKD